MLFLILGLFLNYYIPELATKRFPFWGKFGTTDRSSVIRQKGQNLKTGVSRKQSRPNFLKNQHSLPPDTYVRCVSGGKKCWFFGKFGQLRFLETPVLRFALLPDYQQYDLGAASKFYLNFRQIQTDRTLRMKLLYLPNKLVYSWRAFPRCILVESEKLSLSFCIFL